MMEQLWNSAKTFKNKNSNFSKVFKNPQFHKIIRALGFLKVRIGELEKMIMKDNSKMS